MKYKEFTVTYYLDESMVDRLNSLTDRWRATGHETTPERLFDLAMTMSQYSDVKNRLETVERFLERQEEGK